MGTSASVLYALIVACELAFWIVLFAAFAVRYLLHWSGVSRFLLICLPLIDIALLAFTILDLRGGTVATSAHGLATAYVGFTIAFGSVMVNWTDRRFARRFGSGSGPAEPPSAGWASVKYELQLWVRCLVAGLITCFLLFVVIELVDQPDNTQVLQMWYRIPPAAAFFWFIFGPLWQIVFLKRDADERSSSGQ